MIGRLRGRVDGRGDNWVLIDVGGVGYMVEGSARMLENLPGDGEAVTLAIETYVREDQLRLFGFLSEEDRSWFRLLMGVQGVGAKVALAIESVLSADDLTQAIAAQDKAMVARAPGVGPKVAQRIVQELKDKIPEAQFIAASSATAGNGGAAAGSKVLEEALSALTNLGYQRSQANAALMAARGKLGDEAESIEALIKQALKEMV
ncbi:MAG: Holliday junction branch migration protein RuvA [PS1 clade bacterium]|uniref:Holliday junction branch migration complex subunit RuvA n=1 Tax=PS1 clade bacterium TaxID=2175152 RepID=A0A937HDI1_9PROT|nr:Holliday junction branch migration protein RuvA [PS1 clade bacterium]